GKVRCPHHQDPRRRRPAQGTPHRPHLRRRDGEDRRAGGSRVSSKISERAFEEAIECALLHFGPDACPDVATATRETSPPYGETPPGGYRKRKPEDYDRALCLLPRDVLDFVRATQPREWKKLEQHHGAAVRAQFLRRLAS